MAIVLLIKTEDGQLTELPILHKVIMGRSGNSDYKIADTKMSGTHCSFDVNNAGQLIFADLGSSNGSFLNNSQITQTLVRVNDVIRIGNTLIKIDETRLSASERIAVGTSVASRINDKTLPGISEINSKAASGSGQNAAKGPKKKTIVLNKTLKVKQKVSSNWDSAENVIDQEASSGRTKFLKLDKKKKS